MAKLSIGEFLSVLRKGRGFTQEEVADKLGVSAKTVSSWENNRTYPDIMMLPVIADMYEITVDELVRGERITKEQTTNDIQVNEKSLLKIRKIKYAKYKEKRLLFTLGSILSSLVSILGLYLMCYVATWTLVFAIVGFLSFVTCNVFIALNERKYLINEGIVIKDDIVPNVYPLVFQVKMNTLFSILISFIPYFIYGLVFLSIYEINTEAFIYVLSDQFYEFSSEITVDKTNVVMTIALICLGISILAFVSYLIIRHRYIKNYSDEENKTKEKKNIKLLIILVLIFPALSVTLFVFSGLSDMLFGPIIFDYEIAYKADTYEEFYDLINAYEVSDQKLIDAGLTKGSRYVLNMPNNFNEYKTNMFYDLDNGFVLATQLDIPAFNIGKLYKQKEGDSLDDYEYISDVSSKLYNSYSTIGENENFIITHNGNNITISREIFEKAFYEKYHIYYLQIKPGTYDLNNGYKLVIEKADYVNKINGLYYRKSSDALLDEWINLIMYPIFRTIDVLYKENDEYKSSWVTTISNCFYDRNTVEDREFLGYGILSEHFVGYVPIGYAEGEYACLSTTYLYLYDYVTEAYGYIFVFELIVELAIGIILFKRQKFDFEFEKINYYKE